MTTSPIKEQAKRLRAFLQAAGLEISHAQSLQAMARAVHNRSWEEVRRTQSATQDEANGDTLSIPRQLLEDFLNSGSTDGCDGLEVFDALMAEQIRALVFTTQGQVRPTVAQLASRGHKKAQALEGLLAFLSFIRHKRLTGQLRFCEESEPGDLYGLTLFSCDAESATAETVIKSEYGDEGLRELADSLTSAGHGEFFDVTLRLEHFEADFIAPLRAELERSGIRPA